MSGVGMINRKAMTPLVLLISWEIWNERNARVFRNKYKSSISIFSKIKNEAKLWVIAGAKSLEELMPGE